MKLSNPFKKKAGGKSQNIVLEPSEMPAPQGVDDFLRRGWAYHSRGQHTQAEGDFRQALALDSQAVDTNYALGLALKSQGRTDQAIQAFEKTISLIESGKIENHARSEMLHRLALGHVNELRLGDWNLEERIWHHVD